MISSIVNEDILGGSESELCFGGNGKDSCVGDGGGPLMCLVEGSYSLVGIVSYGNGCGWASYPGRYVNVHFYSDWIKNGPSYPFQRNRKQPQK